MADQKRRAIKRKPNGAVAVKGGFVWGGERWSKTPDGYRPNGEILEEMQRDFG